MKAVNKKEKNKDSERNRSGHALWIRVLALILAISMVLGVLIVGVGSFGF